MRPGDGDREACGAGSDAIREPMDLALLRDGSLELVVELLDLVDDLGCVGDRVTGRDARERFGIVRGRRGDPLRCGPERALIDGGEQCDALADRVDRREVVRAHDQMGPSRVRVEAGARQQIDLAARAHELVADVLCSGHVDDAVALALRTEDREVPTRCVAQLEVHAGAAAAERADDLADEALTLGRAEARDDRKPRMEVERERAAARLDDDSLALHQPSNRHVEGRN